MRSAPLSAAALLAVVAAAAAADEPAATFGSVELVEGAVTVQAPGGAVSTPKQGDSITAGSTIVTGSDGEIHIATADSGYVALRPGTQLRVDQYRADGGDDDVLSLSLVRGTFRAITGWIGQFNRDNYRITTPTATIGIRGTDHEPGFVTEEDAARLGEEAGTYDKVNDGGSYIQNAQGRADLQPNQSGFVPHRGALKPRLLEHAPRFYRVTRNERRIVMRRAAVRRAMVQRRTERRAIWKQRHPNAGRAGRPGAQAKEQQHERRQQMEQRKQRQEQRKEQVEKRKEQVEQHKQKAEERKKAKQKRENERNKDAEEHRD